MVSLLASLLQGFVILSAHLIVVTQEANLWTLTMNSIVISFSWIFNGFLVLFQCLHNGLSSIVKDPEAPKELCSSLLLTKATIITLLCQHHAEASK
jgi:hypothetical protein